MGSWSGGVMPGAPPLFYFIPSLQHSNTPLLSSPVTLARDAMNTRFELVLHGDNQTFLRTAGEEALAEIQRIENCLSLFRPTTEIARVNAFASQESVLVSPEVFALLERAQRLSAETEGAFDITLAPLLHCWGLLGHREGRVPNDGELAAARDLVGMNLVQLDSTNRTVRFVKPGVKIDLGAIGKGYAIEQAAGLLREAGVTSALLHGGTSSVQAIGTPPDADAWKLVIEGSQTGETPAPPDQLPSATILLRDESISVSAIRGKCFFAEGRTLGHVIDPRTGKPTTGAMLAAVVLPSATEGDAFSTALLVLGPGGRNQIEALRPGMRTWLQPS